MEKGASPSIYTCSTSCGTGKFLWNASPLWATFGQNDPHSLRADCMPMAFGYLEDDIPIESELLFELLIAILICTFLSFFASSLFLVSHSVWSHKSHLVGGNITQSKVNSHDKVQIQQAGWQDGMEGVQQ